MYKRLRDVWESTADIQYPFTMCTSKGESQWRLTKTPDKGIVVKAIVFKGDPVNQSLPGTPWSKIPSSWLDDYYLYEERSKQELILEKIKYLDQRYDKLRSEKRKMSRV